MKAILVSPRFLLIILGTVLAGCNFPITGDVTPPAGSAQRPTLTVEAQQSMLPIVAPDPRSGEETYHSECASCHGTTGYGDGPLTSELPVPPAALADPVVAAKAKPVDWFTVVSNGRLERMMPRFSVTLSERQRWDVVSYALNLGIPNSMLAEGENLYGNHCADCHGERGAGDGNRVSSVETVPTDWTAPPTLVQYSLEDLQSFAMNGVPPSMPAFGNDLSGEQLLAVSAYTRSLGYAIPGEEMVELPISPAEQPNAEMSALMLEGAAQTADGARAPAGLQVFLEGYDGFQLAWNSETVLDDEGRFSFIDVPLVTGRLYFARVDYQGVSFYSNAIHSNEMKRQEMDRLLVTIFPSSHDLSRLFIERLHVFFDFIDQDSMQVVQMFNIANPDPFVIVPEAGKGALHFHLPAGASDLQFQDGEAGGRYILTENGFSDTGSIPPAPEKHQVIFGFNLPYQRRLSFDLPLALPVESIMVAVPAGGVQVVSDQLTDGGTRVIEGGTIKLYEGGRLRAGETLTMVISGRPGRSPSLVSENNGSILTGVAVLLIVLVLGGTWLQRTLWRKQDPGESVETSEGIIDSILALDDQYQDGKIQEEGYLIRRSGLRARLKDVLERENRSIKQDKR